MSVNLQSHSLINRMPLRAAWWTRGRFSSVSAVIQNGLDLLRQKTEADEAETAALQLLLVERQGGTFVSGPEIQSRVSAMIGRKRRGPRVER